VSLTFEEILARASLAEDTVTLCLDGRVLDEIGALQRRIAEAPPPVNLGDDTRARLQEQLAGAVERMRASQVDFHLRALPGPEWNAFYAASPTREDKESDEDWAPRIYPWLTQMVSRTCTEPAMTAEQVTELAGRLHATSWNRLTNACWLLNRNEVEVPNFDPVSDGTPRSAPTSAPPTAPASATPASAGASPPRRPRTSTTRPVDSSAA